MICLLEEAQLQVLQRLLGIAMNIGVAKYLFIARKELVFTLSRNFPNAVIGQYKQDSATEESCFIQARCLPRYGKIALSVRFSQQLSSEQVNSETKQKYM